MIKDFITEIAGNAVTSKSQDLTEFPGNEQDKSNNTASIALFAFFALFAAFAIYTLTKKA